ncbi:hypothetical protein [Mycoplasmoides alvi]|uniref:hypothetical protein n=1 Tax=Mycoplasmoides alvi TaxID=78580 RepID=UPI00051B40F7|nr:hypothetical protein [Mycoplasmoides alvi]
MLTKEVNKQKFKIKLNVKLSALPIFLSSILLIGSGLSFCLSDLSISTKQSNLLNKSLSKDVQQPIENVSDIFKNIDNSNLNQVYIDCGDVNNHLLFDYDTDPETKISEELDVYKDTLINKLSKLRISNELPVDTFGYCYPMFQTYKNNKYYPEKFVNRWIIEQTIAKYSGMFIDWQEQEYWPNEVYNEMNNSEAKTNDGYFSLGEQVPIIMSENNEPVDSSNANNSDQSNTADDEIIDLLPRYPILFKLWSKDSQEINSKKWIWSDSNIFNIFLELFKRKKQINPTQDLYLWFVQTGTKVVYESKNASSYQTNKNRNYEDNSSKNLGPNFDSIYRDDLDKAFNQWINSWDKKYIVSPDSKIQFLDITQEDYSINTHGINRYSTYINRTFSQNSNNKITVEYTPYYSPEPLNSKSNYDSNKAPNINDYNFKDGIAFFIKIATWAPYILENDNIIYLDQLFQIFNKIHVDDSGKIQTYNNLSLKTKNLNFFKNSEPVKQNILKITSANTIIPYIDQGDEWKNYALKTQILNFAQTSGSVDIKNYIVPKTYYDNGTNSCVLTFQFNENFVNMILNLYNLTMKGMELFLNKNDNSDLYRKINHAAIDYKTAYSDMTSTNESWSANWYLESKQDFGLNLDYDYIPALGECVYLDDLQIVPQNWMILLEWIKNSLSNDIYVDYKVGSNGEVKKLKIWDGTNYTFVNDSKIVATTENKQIVVTNLSFDNNLNLPTNLIAKLKIDDKCIQNGSCQLSSDKNSLVYKLADEVKDDVTVDPSIPDSSNPSTPKPDVPSAPDSPNSNQNNNNNNGSNNFDSPEVNNASAMSNDQIIIISISVPIAIIITSLIIFGIVRYIKKK